MPRPRTPSRISESLHQRLNSYALAASAAGVGVMTLAQPAQAKIVYKHVHTQIVPNNTVPLDLNGDGKTDFNFHDSFTCTSFCEYIEGAITILPARPANEIVGYVGRSFHYASALVAGVRVGPKSPFSQGNKVMVSGGYDAGTTSIGACFGPWKDLQNRYLGLRLSIKRKIDYGWARLSETCAKNGENTALLTGYAYETIPNAPIIAGKTHGKDVITLEPASLGHLARGASAIPAWRGANLAK